MKHKRIIFLAHLQTKIGEVSFVTSCRHVTDVMTSRYGVTTLCEYKNDDICELGNRSDHGNKDESFFQMP